jgi:hypothetical protein
MRWKRVGAGVLAVAAFGAVGFFTWYQLVKAGVLRYNKWDRRQKGALDVGDPVPDLTVVKADGSPLHLAGLWNGRPTLLVFGSCT